jgi:hypothetical protein
MRWFPVSRPSFRGFPARSLSIASAAIVFLGTSGCGIRITALTAARNADAALGPRLSIVAGDGQTARPNVAYSTSLRVRAIGADGEPLAGVQIGFYGERGGATIDSAVATTDASGYASASAISGAKEPDQTVVARPIGGTLSGSADYPSVRFALSSSAVSSTASFVAQATQSTSGSAYAIATGDLDGDGILDLVTAQNALGVVHVFIGNGDGTFGAPTAYAAGTTPYSISLADLNGDGRLDIVATNRDSASVSVFLASGAPGAFGAKTDYAVGTSPYASAIADFDSDGRPDIAVANRDSGTVSVLYNTSTAGVFAAAVTLTAGTGTRAVQAGDLNGDGRPDIVAANWDSNDLTIFLSSGTPGTFSAGVSRPVGTQARSLGLADFKRDGLLDIAVANYGDATVGILLNPPATPGTFGVQTTLASAVQVHCLAVADVNGDGLPDVISGHANANGTYVFLNDSATPGTFGAATAYATGTPFSLAVGDFDLDGKIDFVFSDASANFRVHLNP